mgnify:CR=1 FL=1
MAMWRAASQRCSSRGFSDSQRGDGGPNKRVVRIERLSSGAFDASTLEEGRTLRHLYELRWERASGASAVRVAVLAGKGIQDPHAFFCLCKTIYCAFLVVSVLLV